MLPAPLRVEYSKPEYTWIYFPSFFSNRYSLDSNRLKQRFLPFTIWMTQIKFFISPFSNFLYFKLKWWPEILQLCDLQMFVCVSWYYSIFFLGTLVLFFPLALISSCLMASVSGYMNASLHRMQWQGCAPFPGAHRYEKVHGHPHLSLGTKGHCRVRPVPWVESHSPWLGLRDLKHHNMFGTVALECLFFFNEFILLSYFGQKRTFLLHACVCFTFEVWSK